MNLKGNPLKSPGIISRKSPILQNIIKYQEMHPYDLQMHQDYKQHRISEWSSNE